MSRRNAARLAPIAVMIACLGMYISGCRDSRETSSEPQETLDRALFEAIQAERATDVQQMLERGASPNAVAVGTHYEDTALTLACKSGNLEIVEALLRAGADPNLRQGSNVWTETCLIIAARSGNTDIVDRLLRAGANVEARAGLLHGQEGGADIRALSALSHAAGEGRTETARRLILEGARVEPADLYSAIAGGHVDTVRLLLRSGADPRWTLITDRTVLEEARRSPEQSRARMVATIERFLKPPELRGN